MSAHGGLLADAYAHCESVTRAQAANFHYGVRLLERDRREAMSAVYAFARRVDDIGDGALEHEEKLRLLAAEDEALARIAADSADAPGASGCAGADLVMVALADARARFELPVEALAEIVAGVRMDVEGVTYESFEDLVLYCRRVAGAVGRVCLAIFGVRAGSDRRAAEVLADELGVALQLTNILRDVREDAANGRVYLPREDLRRFAMLAEGAEEDPGQALAAVAAGIAGADGDGADGEAMERLAALVRYEAARAREWFDRGLALVPLLDRRSAGCVLAMAGIYRRLLDRIELHPEQAARRRMSLPAHEKVWVAARGMLGGGR